MNTLTEETLEIGDQRRRSIGSGGGLSFAGGKTRRYSIGITTSRKSTAEEGNLVPNYLRASTGSCHDFCKFGKKHEHSKSVIPVKFKRTTTIVKKDKLPVTEIKPPAEPVKLAKKDVVLPSKKPQVYKQTSSTDGKTTKNELKTFNRTASVVKSSPLVVNREGSNVGVRKKDIKTVKKTGMTTKTSDVKKVAAKVTPNVSQSHKAYFSRAASLKAIKSMGVKRVSPLKDQNRMLLHKTEPKHTIADKVQTKSSRGVEAESEVKPETMETGFIQPSIELVTRPVCSYSESLSGKIVVEEELPVIHPVYESSELFSVKEVVEELLVVESLQSCSDKEILEEEAILARPLSESSESFYDDEALEHEFGYTDDEEAEVSEDGSETETANVNEMETSVMNQKIPRKGKMVVSENRNDEAVKLRFRRGKVLDLQSESNSPRRLKFRRRVIEGKEDGQIISRKTYKNRTLDLHNEDTHCASRTSFEKKYAAEINDSNNGPESVVLKHQGEQEKKDAAGLLNNVIEETASKLVESRKSKVKALVGAFETVISLHDGKPSSA